MRPFAFERVTSAEAAVASAAGNSSAAFLGGGTTLVDLMKLGVLRPGRLVDINPLTSDRYGAIEIHDTGFRLGALVRMAEAAEHPTIRREYPVIAESLALAASQQLRNMATLGGNVLQRTRCPYFRDPSWPGCNRREPGSGCDARNGFNRLHAVLGTSDHCIATYPGDFAQALIALDAAVEIHGPEGTRTVPFPELHRLPEETPHIETSLRPGDLIAAFIVPAGPWARRSLYLKIRDRESYAFALASAAVALDLRDGEVAEARIALGGVATVPWRAREAEDAIKGGRLDEKAAERAAEAAFAGAIPLAHNAFKIALGKRTLVRALLQAREMEI